MAEQESPFTKLHIEEVTQAKRTLLDELDLPPKVTKFIKGNADTIKIVLVATTVLVCAWSFYNYYTLKQKNDSTALLATAMTQSSGVERTQALDKVIDEYSGSGAALWSQIAKVNGQMEKKEYSKAQEELGAIIGLLSKDNPLYGLVSLNLAQAYELGGDLDKALVQYGIVRDMNGFTIIGYQGEARVYEQKNDSVKARETYEKLNTQSDLNPALREWVESKIK